MPILQLALEMNIQSDIFLGSGTLKNRSKIWVEKRRVQKNRVIGIQKRRSSLTSSLFE